MHCADHCGVLRRSKIVIRMYSKYILHRNFHIPKIDKDSRAGEYISKGFGRCTCTLLMSVGIGCLIICRVTVSMAHGLCEIKTAHEPSQDLKKVWEGWELFERSTMTSKKTNHRCYQTVCRGSVSRRLSVIRDWTNGTVRLLISTMESILHQMQDKPWSKVI